MLELVENLAQKTKRRSLEQLRVLQLDFIVIKRNS